MTNLNHYIQRILKSVLLVLFIGYYSSNAMLYHTHNVNGKTVSHSHPYKHNKDNKKTNESHSHSSSAYNYLHQLNETSWKDTSVRVNVPGPTISQLITAPIIFTPFIEASAYSLSLLRAPPATC